MGKKAENNEKNNETRTNKSGNKRGMTPASQENLKPIQPGEVRNPKGRPKGVLNYKTRLNIALEGLAGEFADTYNAKYATEIKNGKRAKYEPEDVDIMGDVFRQYVNMARNGNLKAIDSLLDRTYGKATTKIEVSGDPDNPIQHEHSVAEVEAEVDQWIEGWFNPTQKTKVTVKKKAHGNSKAQRSE